MVSFSKQQVYSSKLFQIRSLLLSCGGYVCECAFLSSNWKTFLNGMRQASKVRATLFVELYTILKSHARERSFIGGKRAWMWFGQHTTFQIYTDIKNRKNPPSAHLPIKFKIISPPHPLQFITSDFCAKSSQIRTVATYTLFDVANVCCRPILISGLIGSMVFVLAFGFSTSFYMAVAARFLWGAFRVSPFLWSAILFLLLLKNIQYSCMRGWACLPGMQLGMVSRATFTFKST